MQHYTNYPSFSEAFIAFASLVREEGLNVGLQESMESLTTALFGLWHDKLIFRYALAALFCKNEEERKHFDFLYTHFWEEMGSRQKSRTTYKNQSNLHRRSRGTVVMLGEGKTNEKEKQDAATTTGANAMESLKRTDFSKINEIDSHRLDELSQKLVREMSVRLRRKQKKGGKSQVDLSQTIRNNIHRGGEMLQLNFRKRRKQKYRLVILLDVSGSMDTYSFYLLRFVWALRAHFRNIEAFVFSTRCLRITDYLLQEDLDIAMSMISNHAQHWSGGTQIGKCLEEFNTQFSRQVMHGKSLTIVLSDGLDTGDPNVLQTELAKIKNRTHKLVWLNPLKGMSGYEPIQKGMQAALGELDIFQSAHNLQSLLTLENIIADA